MSGIDFVRKSEIPFIGDHVDFACDSSRPDSFEPRFFSLNSGMDRLVRIESERCVALLASIDETSDFSTVSLDRFLSENETARLREIRSVAYRKSWIIGRYLAKALILRERKRLEIPRFAAWNDLNVRTRDESGRGVRPNCSWQKHPIDRFFSISHSESLVMVAMGKKPETAVGCDLVVRHGVTSGIVETFFLPSECHPDSQRDDIHDDCVWAVKEAAYKTLGNGRSFRPRRWKAERLGPGQYRCIDLDSPRSDETRVNTFVHEFHVVALSESNLY